MGIFDGLPKTTNIKLNKPGYDNAADIEALNENADILDAEISKIKGSYVTSVDGAKPDSKGNVNIADMEGATFYTAGKAGLVPIPAAGKQDMALCGDATYKVLPLAGGGTGATDAKTACKNLGAVRSVNGVSADASGNVDVPTYSHPNSGVIAGTYRAVTVNAQGHVTADSNPDKAYITETYRNGTTWYRKYSDGFKMCGLRATFNKTGWIDVTLPLAFSNTNYTIIACDTSYGTIAIACQPSTTSKIQGTSDETTVAHIIVQGY